MQAIILAAGMGKRLGRYTKEATKCMVKVNGKTLIEYAIESLVQNNIRKLIMVIGYKGDVLRDFIKEKFNKSNLNGMEIEYIENPIYDKTNNIYSLYLACDKLMQDDTILLESDLIYRPQIISKLIESSEKNLAVVSPFESWMDGTCTMLDDNNYITGIIDKKHFDWKNTGAYFKTVNIYKFSKEFSNQYYVPFLEAYKKAFGENEYYEQVLKVLSFLSASILKGLTVSGDTWYEIDDPADLAIAENRFATGKEKLSKLQHRFGGYWRFPKLKDYCYLVNPYFPPQKMIDELSSNFESLLAQYPSGAAEQSILAGKIFNILPENIVVGNGAAELISSLGKKLRGKVLVPYPTFNEYPERFDNAEIVPLLTDKNNFSYTAQDILKAAKENECKTVLLINPDNPSGSFIKEADMLDLLTGLKEINATILFDESFIDFADSNLRYTLLKQEILDAFPNLIVVKSISKSYGVPGLRLGILANTSKDFIQDIKKKNSIWNINSFAEYFLQIYEKYKGSYSIACDAIANERKRFINDLKKLPHITVYPSQANFILCKFDDTIRSDEIAVKMLEEADIFIKDLTGKKCFPNSNFIRLAIRSKEDNEKLVEYLKNKILL